MLALFRAKLLFKESTIHSLRKETDNNANAYIYILLFEQISNFSALHS